MIAILNITETNDLTKRKAYIYIYIYMKVKVAQSCPTPWDTVNFMEFFRPEYWSG